MTNTTEIVDGYLTAYGEPDATKREALIARVFAEDAALIDPPLTGERHDGISAMAATMQQHFPGHRFRRSSGIDAHHDHARYAWELVGPDGAVAAAGVDVVDLASDGRLQRVVGFFGDLPAAD